jgi:acyl-coenzyme A thioesterase PaaI-like protein
MTSSLIFRLISMANRFSLFVNKVNKSPQFMHSFLLTALFTSKVKFAGTTGVKIEKVTQQQAILSLKNKKSVQNHIGGVHAIAAALLAESATGIVFGMNVADDRVPLLKSMTIEYQRRMQGSLKAVANLTTEQISIIKQQDKGDMTVSVAITDDSGQMPIICMMEWAWVSKKR